MLDETNATHAEVLNNIKRRFREETFTRQSIEEAILAQPDLVRMLYVHFAMTHYPAAGAQASQLMPTLSYQRLQVDQPLTDEELYDRIRKSVSNKHELQIFESFLVFNQCVPSSIYRFLSLTKLHTDTCSRPTSTNRRRSRSPSVSRLVSCPKSSTPRSRTACSSSLAPSSADSIFASRTSLVAVFVSFVRAARSAFITFLFLHPYPYADVATSARNYSINQRSLFDENYALASTQNLKNKDIPEGGAKGAILPSLGASHVRSFEKYVDAVIDLLIPGQTPGIKEQIVDLYAKPEILFFGPDEGTADLMDWAALHAKARGADAWWKSFTTGKSAAKLGGVPHDAYGMTSLSVRQYVLGIYKHLGLKEANITKVQTGGPDGDLGSNEILPSSDKTVAVIDGSGVLADPAGLDREELRRLAKLRVPVGNFDKTKLSKDGYLVLVEDQDVKLPCEFLP